MRGISVNKAAEICKGRIFGGEDNSREITSVCIDSRKACSGAMFAALKGEHVDGHDYISKAFELGAVCCLAEHVPEGVKGAVIVVEDVALALKVLAEAYRRTLNIPIIGIAGSVGKTTAKEMIAAVLSQRYNVLKTDKNLNNELGVPLTIFRIEPEHEVAVIEMGISDFGEMRRLAKMVRPTMALYTVIGHCHLEQLVDRNGVLKAKTEMLEYMSDDAILFMNGDDDLLAGFECKQRKVLYGLGENSAVRAENVISDSLSGLSCDVVAGDRRFKVDTPVYGLHMVNAVLEGAAVGIEFGFSDEEIARGIASFEVVGRRANVVNTGYITLIDDCYNANPDSVKMGIKSFPNDGSRKVCILGDMYELGTDCDKLHREVGEFAAENGVQLVLTVGEFSKHLSAGAAKTETKHFNSNDEIIPELKNLIKKGDTVLVKASHIMKFEEISEALKLL